MSFKHMFATWAGLAIAGAALSLFVSVAPATAAGMDASKEIATAAQHAGYAAAAKDLKMAQAHLHHVINCLVGPKGRSFDSAQLNPCKDLGNGALPDTKDAAKKKELRMALAKAKAGLRAKKLETAQKDATASENALKSAM